MLSGFTRSCPFKLYYSKVSIVNSDFKAISGKLISEFQNVAKEILSSGSNLGLLESFKVKLSSEKGLVPLPKLCTLNLIDAQRVEILVIDQAVSNLRKRYIILQIASLLNQSCLLFRARKKIFQFPNWVQLNWPYTFLNLQQNPN
jgi:hypothetical protein